MVEHRSPKPLMWVQLLLPLPCKHSRSKIYVYACVLDLFLCLNKIAHAMNIMMTSKSNSPKQKAVKSKIKQT